MDEQGFSYRYLRRRGILNYIMLPATGMFSLITRIRRFLYQKLFHTYESRLCVVSVGNIVVGGSGKTPMTIFIAHKLKEMGYKSAVSHRGYKSELENGATLISDREKLLPIASLAGDEAKLLAERLPGIPVVAGKNRRQAIRLLERTFPDLDCVILDDSFQHLKVRHDLDIIVVNHKLGFGNGFVLPAGMLREPLSALASADIIALNLQAGDEKPGSSLVKRLDEFHKPLLTGTYQVSRICNTQGEIMDNSKVRDAKIAALAAIANPDGFLDTLQQIGITPIIAFVYPDHYAFADRKVRTELKARFEQLNLDWLITTEKDYAKLCQYPELSKLLLILSIDFVPLTGLDELHKLLAQTIKSKKGL